MMHRCKTGPGVLTRFAQECAGATAIEYALIAGGISIAIVAAVSGVGSEVAGLYTLVLESF